MATITELLIENVKRVSVLHVDTRGKPIVVIGGDNGAGKSSVLDSVMYAMAGTKSIPDEPIKRGKGDARVSIVIDGDPPLRVTRKWSGNRTTLEVAEDTKHGPAKLNSPQRLLDTLCGRIAFDPLDFTRQKPAEQVSLLKELVGVDTDKIDLEITSLYDARTEQNRQTKALQGEVDAFPDLSDVPDDPVSTSPLLDRLQRAVARNKDITSLQETKQRCKERIAELKAALADTSSALQTATARLRQMGKPQDTEQLREEIEAANSLNMKVNVKLSQKSARDRLQESLQLGRKLTEKLESSRTNRMRMVEQAKWPIPGLGFNSKGVIYNDLPFEQASSAEQLRIAVAIGIAMNPTLRILLIRDGSLLDERSLAKLTEIAEQNAAQLWIERVSKGDECTVVLEDGTAAKEDTLDDQAKSEDAFTPDD